VSVLVDTPIWSMLFRRKAAVSAELTQLRDLVQKGQAQIIGPIRQEVLSGMRNPQQFARVREGLRAFPNLPLSEMDFERAAEFYNLCRSVGVQGSNTDFLICAVAELNGLQIYTSDKDFARFAKHLPIELV
jgi:predicted nucleic acid-binding protein